MINPLNSNFQKKDNKTKCPDCDFELNIPCDIEKGEIISCPGCGLELEVKKTNCGGGCVSSSSECVPVLVTFSPK